MDSPNTIQQQDERKGGTSASNAEPDLRCPARFLRQKPYPEVTGEFAEFGNLIHDALAENAQNQTALKKLSLPQREIFDQCREVEKKLLLRFFPDQGSQFPVKIFREQRFWVIVDGKFIHSGKADFIARSGSRGLIIEYKTLPGDVPESPENRQLRDQMVLASGHLLLDEVGVAVDQPLVTMDPVITVYKADDIKRAEAEMFERVRRSNDPNSPALAGEVQCKFCRAKPHCIEYQKFAGTMVPGMLNLLEVPVAVWTPSQRGYFCEQESVARTWLDETKEAIKAGAQLDPNFVEGWYMAPGAKRDTIVDPQSVFNRFAALGGTVGKFMGTVSVGMGKLREALNDLTGARGKALDAAMKTLTEGLVETKQNAPSLKRKDKEK